MLRSEGLSVRYSRRFPAELLLPACRLREPPEAGPDGELHRPPEQRAVPETQPPPEGALPGGEPLRRVPGLPAVRRGRPASAKGGFTQPAEAPCVKTKKARTRPVCVSPVAGRDGDQPVGADRSLAGPGEGEEASKRAGGGAPGEERGAERGGCMQSEGGETPRHRVSPLKDLGHLICV